MNTLIVPTDFSPAAEKAVAYAAQLAKQIEASVVLLHVYSLPVPMTDYPVIMVTADDVKKIAESGLAKALEEATKNFAGVVFETESRLGDVMTEIEACCKERDPFALVAGMEETKGFDRFLFGDTALSLIKNCSYPVIVVPETSTTTALKNIMLATDLLNAADLPTTTVKAIASVLGATLHIVHVEAGKGTDSPEDLMAAFADTNTSYHPIQDDDVTEGLKQYVLQNSIDLVLLLPHKHNLYERLFFKDHAEGILHTMPVPVMSLRNE